MDDDCVEEEHVHIMQQRGTDYPRAIAGTLTDVLWLLHEKE
jgi:hypothetical protein